MRAIDEVKRLIDKIASGDLPPDEPLFVLRAQDIEAADSVRDWSTKVGMIGTPDEKVLEARRLAAAMDEWPVKQTPGRPDTRRTTAK